jgi:hypothetical protein
MVAVAKKPTNHKANGTGPALARLKKLRDKAGSLVYERVKLAASVYADRNWVAASFRGDPNAAAAHLQEEYFADLCDAVSFLDLLGIFKVFPEEREWAEHKYSVKRLFAALPKEEKAPRERRGVTIKEHEEEISRRKDAEFAAKRAREEAETLQARVKELEMENAKLKGRIEELERITLRHAG